jgi:hypothetical protein
VDVLLRGGCGVSGLIFFNTAMIVTQQGKKRKGILYEAFCMCLREWKGEGECFSAGRSDAAGKP